MQNFQSLGQNTFTDLLIAPTTHSFNVNATKVWGAHTTKMGSDYRKFLLNFTQLFFPSGQFAFNNAQWTQRNPNVSSGTQGAALASMLLGIPTSVNMSHNPSPASSSSYWSGYVQDDWRIARNLTINLGLRYEFDVPRTERFDRLAYFDRGRGVAARGPRAGESRSSIRRSSADRSCSWTPTTGGRWTPTTTTSARVSASPGVSPRRR